MRSWGSEESNVRSCKLLRGKDQSRRPDLEEKEKEMTREERRRRRSKLLVELSCWILISVSVESVQVWR